VSRHQKRLAFLTALNNCNSIKAAAEAVGVHENTGQRWAKQARGRSGEALADAARRVIASKDEVAEALTVIGFDPTIEPPARVKALTELNAQRGYHEPTRIHSEHLVIHASAAQWIEAQRLKAIDATPSAPALPAHATNQLHIEAQRLKAMDAGGEQRVIAAGGDPPIEATAEALSQSPNIPKNPESGPR
jgi:transposase-like protein